LPGKRDTANQSCPPPGSGSAADPAAVAPHFRAAGASFGELHGRILQVSRLATIGEMAAGIAHELNQPLTAIANYANAADRLLGRPHPDAENVRTALREITAQAIRAADILRRLRSLAQSQGTRRQPADISAVIEEIRDLILADGRIHGARVEFELGTRLPPVSIDAAQIQHVVLNLVRNAFEALSSEEPSRRTLHVRTHATADGDVETAICDTGPGLSSEALGRMFDPFFSTKSYGTGLGLAISNTVVRAHGGTLGHRSNSPRGACFYVRFPAEEVPEERT
jgi:two-component system, LuxR family, sensor kinase FixL